VSGRRFRKLLLFAAALAVGYWIFKDRPTVSGIIDFLTNPLMGSRAAVKTSERNRVNADAASAITEQTEQQVGSLREGMSSREVRELLGDPDSIEGDPENPNRFRWTYVRARRTLVVDEGRVVSILVR
jgi:SmpA / OmlA family